MPVRFLRPTSRSVTGHRAAPSGRAIAYESTLERDFITLMLFDPAVSDIDEQPLTIAWTDAAGKPRRYTPDFLLRRGGRSALIEVKPEAVLVAQAADLEPKFAAARAYAKTQGWRFEVWTEVKIRTSRLENAKFLLDYRRYPPDPGVAARLLKLTSAQSAPTVSSLLDEGFPDPQDRARALSELWRLISTDAITIDLDTPLTMNTPIRGKKRRAP